MKKVTETLNFIKKETGLTVRLYSSDGELLCSGGNAPAAASVIALPDPALLLYAALPVYHAPADAVFFGADKGGKFICAVSGNVGEKEVFPLIRRLVESELASAGGNVDFYERLRLYLTGDAGEVHKGVLRGEFKGRSMDYYLLALSTTPEKLNELSEFITTISAPNDIAVKMDKRTLVYMHSFSADDEYRSVSEFAEVLYDNIKEELRIELKIVVGGAIRDFESIPSAYQHAVFSLSLGAVIDPEVNVYSYKEYVFIKMLSELPKSTLTSYLGLLTAGDVQDVLSDDELMKTADIFLKNSLNISETSRSMYMHRNTLIYRLDKIEKETGLNIRHFSDALTFRIITVLSKLIKKEKR